MTPQPPIVRAGTAPLPEPTLALGDVASGLDTRHYVRVLRRSAGPIVWLVAAVTVAAGLSALRTPRVYQAEAMLLVEPRDPRVVDIQGIATEAVEDETRYLRTQY